MQRFVQAFINRGLPSVVERIQAALRSNTASDL